MRNRLLSLVLLLAFCLTSGVSACTWLKEHAARPAPAPAPAEAAAANATALPPVLAEDLAPAPEAEPAPPQGLRESDLDEPNPPGTRQKYGPRDRSKAPAGKSSEQCYKLSRSKKGRCEPQCIPYARCRTGIDSCRLGAENNSLTWYACEKRRKNTTTEPGPGMVMILQSNPKRNMPSGHALVVEKATPQGKDAWLLVVSHSNWDTRCSLETNAKVLYNRRTMRSAFLSGEWKEWATDLVVLGFIAN